MDREVIWGDISQDNQTKRKLLEDLLPWKQKYKVLSFQILEESDIACEVKFKASLDINICDKDGLNEFQGRKVKDLEMRTQMVTEADDGVYHSLPKQKKQLPKQVHSLNAAVQANRAGTKKH